MKIAEYLKKNKRNKFIIEVKNKNLPVIDIVKFINVNSNGFCLIKEKKKYKIFTDGDFRRLLIKNSNFVNGDNNVVKFKKIISIDVKRNLYDAYRLITKNQINCLIVKKNNKIFSYLTLHEITEVLSPERLNLDNKKLNKYNLDISKHLIRYIYASNFITKKSLVLDAACGTGYGTYIMSKKAKNIYGVDISAKAIAFAKSNYKAKNIKFINLNILDINFKQKFDVIVSLETIEHLTLEDALSWFRKCNYLLNKEGIFVCSSPLLRIRNKKPFITNPHHLYEMKKSEFFYNLKKIFKPKKINSYIQQNDNLIPLTNQKEGLSIISLIK